MSYCPDLPPQNGWNEYTVKRWEYAWKLMASIGNDKEVFYLLVETYCEFYHALWLIKAFHDGTSQGTETYVNKFQAINNKIRYCLNDMGLTPLALKKGGGTLQPIGETDEERRARHIAERMGGKHAEN